MLVGRRDVLVAGAALAFAGRALAGPAKERIDTVDITSPDFDLKDLFVSGDVPVGARFSLLVPKGLPRGTRVPLVVALHGLGESHDEELGVHAWPEAYGLKTAYERLRHPPVARQSQRKDFTDERIEEVNRALSTRPFRGVAVACPFTPHIDEFPDPKGTYDAYADWIMNVVIPRSRQEAPVLADASGTAIVGCSMGGPVAIEIFSRHPEAFGSFGLVQGAVGVLLAEKHAKMISDAAATSGPKDVLLLSSGADPYRQGHEALAKALEDRGVPHTLRIPPGPHDQPWLRETGSIELLMYEDARVP
jgi:pimeloyl-ACP methyl ester carboxylesterase